MARVNITMPDSFMAQLLAEADVRKTRVSTLIAECIKDQYSDPAKAEYEEQLKALRQKCDATQLELLHAKEQSAQHGLKKKNRGPPYGRQAGKRSRGINNGSSG